MPKPCDGSVVVFGGANLDIKAQSAQPAIAATSNPGLTATSAGGVGRNIAENLARLGTKTCLVAAVGRDAMGDGLIAQCRDAGLCVEHILRTESPTGTYTAVLDNSGELLIGIASMDATDAVTPEVVADCELLIANAQLVVADGNLRVDSLHSVLSLAARHQIRVLLDPVSDPKASRISELFATHLPAFLVTPNRAELASLTSMPVDTDAEMAEAAARLHQLGVEHVWVRLGPQGSRLYSRLPDSTATPVTGAFPSLPPIEVPAPPVEVVDVTGAGDAMAAAFVHSILQGQSLRASIQFAHGAAALTIASSETVRQDLSEAAIGAVIGRELMRPVGNKISRYRN